jgi:hypothetical protein
MKGKNSKTKGKSQMKNEKTTGNKIEFKKVLNPSFIDFLKIISNMHKSDLNELQKIEIFKVMRETIEKEIEFAEIFHHCKA